MFKKQNKTYIIETMKQPHLALAAVAYGNHGDAHVVYSSKMIRIACLKIQGAESLATDGARARARNEVAQWFAYFLRKKLIGTGAGAHEVEYIVFVRLPKACKQ